MKISYKRILILALLLTLLSLFKIVEGETGCGVNVEPGGVLPPITGDAICDRGWPLPIIGGIDSYNPLLLLVGFSIDLLFYFVIVWVGYFLYIKLKK